MYTLYGYNVYFLHAKPVCADFKPSLENSCLKLTDSSKFKTLFYLIFMLYVLLKSNEVAIENHKTI